VERSAIRPDVRRSPEFDTMNNWPTVVLPDAKSKNMCICSTYMVAASVVVSYTVIGTVSVTPPWANVNGSLV